MKRVGSVFLFLVLTLTVNALDFPLSGIYPDLCTYSQYNDDGSFDAPRHEECGIGAVVPWAGKLWMINYGPHLPEGSNHKLFSIDKDMKMSVHPESVGGTPACRMIHRESNQLIIGPYFIDADGKVRVISPAVMPGRLTAVARHLYRPETMVYFYDMEGMIYEVDVYTLAVKRLYKNPLPGWHGKGAYTGDGVVYFANNGEDVGSNEQKIHWKVPLHKYNRDGGAGILASWDGKKFNVIERSQFTDITGPGGIYGGSAGDPVWAIGWNAKSLRLKIFEDGKAYTLLLPKAAFNNDPSHGWFTEWPRIRKINDSLTLMDMHGMFFDFPASMSGKNFAGLRPIGSHLRYIPDFCEWNGQLVLATDETSIQGNPLAGQPQSNLWFGQVSDLKKWGPVSGFGGIFAGDTVKGGYISYPFLVGGFDYKQLHFYYYGGETASVIIEKADFKEGSVEWSQLRSVELSNGYSTQMLGDDVEWVRLKVVTDAKLDAWFHLTENLSKREYNPALFESLIDGSSSDFWEKGSFSVTFPDFASRDLLVAEINRDKFESFSRVKKSDYSLVDDISRKALFSEKKDYLDLQIDTSSIVIESYGKRLRLPKSRVIPDSIVASNLFRKVREVESERILANLSGIFYEVPLRKVGEPEDFYKMRPVAAHDKIISDFSTWSGFLVLSGVDIKKAKARADKHVLFNEKNDSALWFGAIDDLWQLGKPVAVGGPWDNSLVKKGEFSDPYIMTGFDKKILRIKSSEPVKVQLYIDYDLSGKFRLYEELDVPGSAEFAFPEGFSAHWIKLKVSDDVQISAEFEYR
ncbi:MAG: hypothetical protein JXR63_03105 [Spirochaetales bacterium]|nr:hypothetical protein [Spirochaetales bacterium]